MFAPDKAPVSPGYMSEAYPVHNCVCVCVCGGRHTHIHTLAHSYAHTHDEPPTHLNKSGVLFSLHLSKFLCLVLNFTLVSVSLRTPKPPPPHLSHPHPYPAMQGETTVYSCLFAILAVVHSRCIQMGGVYVLEPFYYQSVTQSQTPTLLV